MRNLVTAFDYFHILVILYHTFDKIKPGMMMHNLSQASSVKFLQVGKVRERHIKNKKACFLYINGIR